MRRVCLLFSLAALLGLAGSARSQYGQPYYPYPQPSPNYYYPPNYYNPNQGYAPQQPTYYYSAPSYPAAPAYAAAQPPAVSQPTVAPAPTPAYAAPVVPAVTRTAEQTEKDNWVKYRLKKMLTPATLTSHQVPAENFSVEPPSVGRVKSGDTSASASALPLASGPDPLPYLPVPGDSVTAAPRFTFQQDPPSSYTIWGNVSYLLWWVKDGGPHIPLLTTDAAPGIPAPGAPPPGSLASPTASTLFGPSGMHYSSFNGADVNLGIWLDEDKRFGVEVSGFALGHQTTTFTAGSNFAGSPPLYVPAFNSAAGSEGRLIVADPAVGVVGHVSFSSSLQVWGTEANLDFQALRWQGLSIELLGGLRYVNLEDTFGMNYGSGSGPGLTTLTKLEDNFTTRNQFIGGQLGARFDYTWKMLTFGLTGKFAVGDNHEVSIINGTSTQTGPGGAGGPFPGGYFTQPSNIGQLSADHISFIPQVNFKVSLNLTQRVSLFAGYDFIYWTGVARAGDQVDRNLNLTQSPVLTTTPGAPFAGQVRPTATSINYTDFWAQGITVGVEFRY